MPLEALGIWIRQQVSAMSDILRYPAVAGATIALTDVNGERLVLSRRMGTSTCGNASHVMQRGTVGRREAARGADGVLPPVLVSPFTMF